MHITKTENGLSALHLACLRNSFKICYLLAQQSDVDFNLLTSDGLTALHIACYTGSHTIADCLLKFCPGLIDVKTVNRSAETALHIAVKSGNFLLTKTLLQHGNSEERCTELKLDELELDKKADLLVK